MRRALVLVLLLAGVWSLALARHPRPTSAHATAATTPRDAATGDYDYYVMALSWSPSYCRSHPEDDEQCTRRGFGFVLHGLWPQYEAGNGPLCGGSWFEEPGQGGKKRSASGTKPRCDAGLGADGAGWWRNGLVCEIARKTAESVTWFAK